MLHAKPQLVVVPELLSCVHLMLPMTPCNVLHKGLNDHSIWDMILQCDLVVQNASQNAVYSKVFASRCHQMLLLILSSPRIVIPGDSLLKEQPFLHL